MKYKNLSIILSLIAILFTSLGTVSCNPGSVKKDTNSKVYNLGKATDFNMLNTIPRILRKYKFEVLHNYDTGSYQTIETEWKNRYPLKDEEEVQITHGRIRLFFRMRKTMDQLYYVRMEVQNMIKTPDALDWFYSPMSEMVEDEMDRMIDDLKQEFDESRLTR